ncbi:recombinase family protein [Falsiroseomonas sp. E2-1-a20]|uniref:recombinase family protein n=1 Tax=Falsiroseomonas sp. E2-1-a20 TaxID=3239300 RepID=UPI003F31CBAC
MRRQTSRAEEYARRTGLELDTGLRDLGVSGYSGEHRRKGALGRFLAAVEAGEVPPGSVLVIEALDRLTREDVLDGLTLVTGLLNAGIGIVTLEDEHSYSREAMRSNPWMIYVLVGKMQQANHDSARKSERVRAGWEAKKRAAAANRTPLSMMCPAWLRLIDGKYEEIPQRAATVQRIFRETAAGDGKDKIVRRLNEERIPTFTREGQGLVLRRAREPGGWHASYVGKLLVNRAVLGEYQPGKNVGDGRRREHDGDPVPDFFPAIIAHVLWDAATASRLGRRGTGGRKGKVLRNLLTGLCRCPACGGTMTMRAKGARRKDAAKPRSIQREQNYLVCDNAVRSLGCTSRTYLPYHRIETALLDNIEAFSFNKGELGPADATIGLEEGIAILTDRIGVTEQWVKRYMNGFGADIPDVAFGNIRQKQTEIDEGRRELARQQAELVQARRVWFGRDHVDAVRSFRAEAEMGNHAAQYAARAKIMQVVRSVVDVVLCDSRSLSVYFGGLVGLVLIRDGRIECRRILPPEARLNRIVPASSTARHRSFPESRLRMG